MSRVVGAAAGPAGVGPFDSSCGQTITCPDGTTEQESYSWRYRGTGS